VLTVVAVALVAVAAVVGAALRAWYLAHDPLNSDEAIVGLMADSILRGHFYAFYWGQAYGGAEFYPVAAMFAIFGHTATALNATRTVLWGGAALLTWRVAARLVPDWRVAALAGALVWVAPAATVYDSTSELGFRGVTVVAGLGCLLFALRLLDGKRSLVDFAGLGLAVGVGCWSSPEIAYFIVPAGVLLVEAMVRSRLRPLLRWSAGAVGALAAFVVGSLPWWWHNLNGGMPSIHNSLKVKSPLNYTERLHTFFHYSAPMQVDINVAPPHGPHGVIAPAIPPWLYAARSYLLVAIAILVVGAVVMCLARGGRTVAIAVAVVAFPFLYAASPDSWYWEDGRYAVFAGPLLALAMVGGCAALVRKKGTADGAGGTNGRAAHRRTRRRWPRGASRLRGPTARLAFMASVLAGATFLTVANFQAETGGGLSAYTSDWGDGNGAELSAIRLLEASGVRAGFANYWVAYRVDFLSGQRLTFTPPRYDGLRSAEIALQARSATRPAWLFQGNLGMPGLTLPGFETHLRLEHVPYRVVAAGAITAVVPLRPVEPPPL
jgi:hypothetical protein